MHTWHWHRLVCSSSTRRIVSRSLPVIFNNAAGACTWIGSHVPFITSWSSAKSIVFVTSLLQKQSCNDRCKTVRRRAAKWHVGTVLLRPLGTGGHSKTSIWHDHNVTLHRHVSWQTDYRAIRAHSRIKYTVLYEKLANFSFALFSNMNGYQ